ncbi:MAG: NAD(P)-dependent oxidoreductase [Thermoflexaceae bacterium]|nr:NAD(P)-dependent oxidoreductase [Thermoflexaceae bacterium]
MTRVLVTGAAGVIGTALLPALMAAGFDVHGFDRTFDPEQELVSGDALADALGGCDAVIHLAACARVAEAEAHPARARRDNVEATATLLRAVSTQSRRPWVVFASSLEVYGRAAARPVRTIARSRRSTATELPRPRPSRSCGERRLTGCAPTSFGSPTSTARHPTTQIAWFPPSSPQPWLGGRSSSAARIGRSTSSTSRDAEAAIISAAEALTRGDAGAGAINACSGVETTLSALAGRVVTLSASDSVFHAADPAPYEVDRFVGDNRAARSALSWVPRVSLDAGLVKIIHSAARLRHPAVAVERMLQ